MRKKFKATLVVFLVVVLGCFSQVFAESNKNAKLLDNTSIGAGSNTQNEEVDQYTKLLMHMDDGKFKDECGHTIINNGVTVDTSNKKFGNSSAYFNGNSGLDIPCTSSEFNFGNKDFTIDFWFSLPSFSGNKYFVSFNSDLSFAIATSNIVSNGLWVGIGNGSSWTYGMETGENSVSFNTWHHFALVRKDSSLSIYLDGTNIKTLNIGTVNILNPNSKITIGYAPWFSSHLTGNIDEFRISNIARWTSNFTPPTNSYNNVLATGITLNKTTDSLTLGQTGNTDQLTAKVTPDDTTNKAVKWTSSDKSIATVDENGKITAVKEGTATITATTQDGSNLSSSCTVTVAGATTISLNKTSDLIDIGGNDTLTATVNPANIGVTWSSSDSSIATVDANGNVKGISAGTAVITVATADGKKVSCTVTVKDQEPSKSKLTLYMNDKTIREFYLTQDEIDAFIDWYNSKSAGDVTVQPYYVFNVSVPGKSSTKKSYVWFMKIENFEVE
ncbi:MULTISPECIES: Ig-like domain-containing protein [Clostridium]|uniref:Ig-like domain-containing protein n=1 Tax=Clostridium TaxID=1485 RepID=UPI000825E85B|nr:MULTISPECIES: Ig-like domain-containing protein [Clostridium]PJI09331.1 hypothetical protein CUB90_16245 [Clostridium sp. CT7]